MESTTLDTMRECAQGSVSGRLTFPDIVAKLTACGVETYHADLYRSETTYYLSNGESLIENVEHSPTPIGEEFSARAVAGAVRDSQQNNQPYLRFLERIMQAGTTQYFVYLKGRCVVYIGRDGSEHVERFPQSQ